MAAGVVHRRSNLRVRQVGECGFKSGPLQYFFYFFFILSFLAIMSTKGSVGEVGTVCGGCLVAVDKGAEVLICSVCGQSYDLDCANVNKEHFLESMTRTERDAWMCDLCKSKMPKSNNIDTPVRGVNLFRGAAKPTPVRLTVNRLENLDDTAHNATLDLADSHALFLELRAFREEVKGELKAAREYMEQLGFTLTAISARVTDCEHSIDKIDDRIEKLERQIDKLGSPEKQVDTTLLSTIENLKSELNERDQDLLGNDVEISCVPETRGESLPHIVITLATKLGTNLTEQDIVSTARVGRVASAGETAHPRPRHIVVRLARRSLRDQILQSARVRRGTTTEGTGLPGGPDRFYVNERLTKTNRQLFRRARELGNRLNWRFVWTRDGRIYVRQSQGRDSPRHRIRTEADLGRVFGPDAVGSA